MKYMLRISDHTYLNLDLNVYEDPALFASIREWKSLFVEVLLNAKVYKKYSETFTEADRSFNPKIELLVVSDDRLESKEKEDEKEG